MSDEEFDDIEDEPEPEVDDDLALDDALPLDDALVVEVIDEVDEVVDEAVDEVVDDPPSDEKSTKSGKRTEDDEDVLELEDEHHPDDVEEPLDVLLHERTASASLEDEEEEEVVEEIEIDDRADGPTKIVPRRPGEFLCTSCFLVLPRSQLADDKQMLCRDCA
jgi:hypothetical protein